MKISRLLPLLLLTPIASPAATWVGPNPGMWNDPVNWSGGVLPALSSGGAVSITGASVTYTGADLTDLKVAGGTTVTVTNGELKQTTTHWAQVNGGTLTLDQSLLTWNTATTRLVAGQVAGTPDNVITSAVNITNNSTVQVAGNLVIGFANYNHSTVTVRDSAISLLGGEVWLGSNTGTDASQTAVLNIYNSSITTGGAVGLWLFDHAASGNSMSINFSGPAGSFIHATDSIGVRSGTGTSNNAETWETAWNLGLLTAEGFSGLTGAVFSDYFQTSGTNVRDSQSYRLTYTPVPEPSASLVSALALAGLLGRRRRPAR